jgi:PAS domain-containing protein
VKTLIGVSVLKEMHNLTDMEGPGALEFDLRRQNALDIHGGESHVCQKTLHNVRTLVYTHDMTREIERREAFVQNLVHNSIDGIIATNPDGTIVIFNRGASNILGYEPEEIVGRLSYQDILLKGTISTGLGLPVTRR